MPSARTPDASATLSDWLQYLESIHATAIDMGLDRVREVADRMDLELSGVKFVVGGTNGKGSTCAMLEAILLAAGYKVGLYTSPHLIDFNERARVNGQIATDAALIEQFVAVEAARGETSLTYFEFTTLAILRLFAQSRLDAVVLEVGLGGRLDAVNIIDADCSVVTSVDLDHTDWLATPAKRSASKKPTSTAPAGPPSAATPCRRSRCWTTSRKSAPTSGCSAATSTIPATASNGPMADANSAAAHWRTRRCAAPTSC